MASSNQHKMSDADRQILRKNRQYLIENLQVDDVWIRMPHIFDKNTEDKIRSETTPQARIIKFLEFLPTRGPEAFKAFIVAAYQSQDFLGKHLAEEAGIDLNDILPAEDENPGMKRVHREVLRHYLPEFTKTLDVEKMVKSLVEARIINSEEQSRKSEVEKLILDLLPRSGPQAFNTFFNALKINQPKFAHELEQSIKKSHPDISNDEEGFRFLTEEWDNFSENNWRRFYKVLKLPEGKENEIAEKGGSPTLHVIKMWIERDGKKATIKKLLEALLEWGAPIFSPSNPCYLLLDKILRDAAECLDKPNKVLENDWKSVRPVSVRPVYRSQDCETKRSNMKLRLAQRPTSVERRRYRSVSRSSTRSRSRSGGSVTSRSRSRGSITSRSRSRGSITSRSRSRGSITSRSRSRGSITSRSRSRGSITSRSRSRSSTRFRSRSRSSTRFRRRSRSSTRRRRRSPSVPFRSFTRRSRFRSSTRSRSRSRSSLTPPRNWKARIGRAMNREEKRNNKHMETLKSGGEKQGQRKRNKQGQHFLGVGADWNL